MICLALLLYAQWSSGTPQTARDFASFWTAGKLALAGHADDAYRYQAHLAAQHELYGADIAGYAAFFYPPVFLPLCAAFALLPFGVAAIVWVGATLAAYAAALHRLLPAPGGVVAALAYPAVFINAAYAQNGFLSAALFGGAALWLERRPALAGLCFGALAYKPQLGLLVPLALAVAGRWRAFAAAAATAAGLAFVPSVAFGSDIWRGFVAASPEARRWMQDGEVGFGKMTSVFAAIRQLGGSLAPAYAAQAVVALAAAAALVVVVRKRPGGAGEVAALVAATLLATPFSLHYDLVALAVPMAWLLAAAARSFWLGWEKTALAAAWLWPAVALVSAIGLGLPLAPLAPAILLLLVWRRAAVSAGGGP